jgi:hypothetical protein
VKRRAKERIAHAERGVEKRQRTIGFPDFEPERVARRLDREPVTIHAEQAALGDAAACMSSALADARFRLLEPRAEKTAHGEQERPRPERRIADAQRQHLLRRRLGAEQRRKRRCHHALGEQRGRVMRAGTAPIHALNERDAARRHERRAPLRGPRQVLGVQQAVHGRTTRQARGGDDRARHARELDARGKHPFVDRAELARSECSGGVHAVSRERLPYRARNGREGTRTERPRRRLGGKGKGEVSARPFATRRQPELGRERERGAFHAREERFARRLRSRIEGACHGRTWRCVGQRVDRRSQRHAPELERHVGCVGITAHASV